MGNWVSAAPIPSDWGIQDIPFYDPLGMEKIGFQKKRISNDEMCDLISDRNENITIIGEEVDEYSVRANTKLIFIRVKIPIGWKINVYDQESKLNKTINGINNDIKYIPYPVPIPDIPGNSTFSVVVEIVEANDHIAQQKQWTIVIF